MFNPRHHGQIGTKRTALQALAETVGDEPRACEKGGSDTQRVMQIGTHYDRRVSRQAIPGVLSVAPTPRRSRVIAPAPAVKDTAGGHQRVTLDQTIAIRGPVCVALPDFWFEKTYREEQRSAAGFDSVNGLPEKEDAPADVDA